MTGRLVLIGGPPRAGKDTVGNMVSSLLGDRTCWKDKLSMELKERTHAMYRLFRRDGKPLQFDFFELKKDRPCEAFLGLTPRQAYIDAHERYWKPVHGEDVLGNLLLQRLQGILDWTKELNLIITDAGDAPQCLPLVGVYGVDNTTLIRLDRPGSQWDNRRAFSLEGVETIEMENNGTSFEDLRETVKVALTP